MKKRNAKIISVILSLSMISGSIAVSADSYKKFEDSFNNMVKWKTTAGTWSVKSGVLKQTSTKEGRIQAGDLSWSNYTIKADVLIDSFEGKSRGAYVCGRYTDGNNYYSVVLSNKDNGVIELRKKVKGSSTVLATVSYEVKEGNWYNVALEMENNQIKVYVNDELLIEKGDNSITSGGIGLISYKSKSSFDNVYVIENNKEEINTAPIIEGKDIEIEEGYTGDYRSLINLSAYDEEDGDITSNIKLVSSNVDINTAGVYEIKYEVMDSKGVKSEAIFNVTVREKVVSSPTTNTKPSLIGESISIEKGYNGDYLALLKLSAIDKEDGDITKDIVLVYDKTDINKVGSYKVKYQVTDSDGNKVSKTFTVKVVEKTNNDDSSDDDNSTVVPDVPQVPETPGDSDSEEKPETSSKEKAEGYGSQATGGQETEYAVFKVGTKEELKEALSAKLVDPKTGKASINTARIISLTKNINLCSDSKGNEYIPGVTPVSKLSWKSSAEQAADVILKVNSNTTIEGNGFTLSGGGLKLAKDTDNVIIRYVNFEDAYDFFPKWSSGEWNTELDNLVLEGSTNIWIDHCTFSDGKNKSTATDCQDKNNPIHHDGLLDIKKGSDYITISNSVFKNHSKSILIGHSDSASSTDLGKLHVTMHDNYFENTNQRLPRVRFGYVHSYNNYYQGTEAGSIKYIYGLGKYSSIYAENNIYQLNDADLKKGKVAITEVMNSGTATYYYKEAGSILNGNAMDTTSKGLSKPYNGSAATPQYKYELTKVTSSNYDTVSANIVKNAGHTAK